MNTSFSRINLTMVRVAILLAVVAAFSAGFAPRLLAEATVIVEDDFKDKRNTPLVEHAPNVSPQGEGWSIERNDGVWFIAKNALREGSKTKEFVSNDYRAVIDVGTTDVTVSVDAKFGGGKQLFGLVANHSGTHSWVMFFYDGLGDMILGADIGDGKFTELGRAKIKWRDNKTRRMELEVTADSIVGSVDGKVLVERSRDLVSGLTGTNAGLFFRDGGTTTFDNFLATGQ
jgi:hypothetical protein